MSKRIRWTAALAAMVVVASLVGVEGPAAAATPTVKLSPAIAPPGQTIVAKGSGFTPSSVVSVDLDGTVLATVTASAKGRFQVSVAVPSSTLPGPHAVTATDPAGVTASATLTVSTLWAGFRFDAAGTGQNPFENVISLSNIDELGQAKTLDLGGAQVTDTPTYAMVAQPPSPNVPTLFFGTGDGVFHAFNASTGLPVWSFTTGGTIESSPALSGGAPVIQLGPGRKPPNPNLVFVGSDDGYLYALDQAAGTLKWSYPTGGPVRSSPVVATGNGGIIMVIFGSDDGTLYALNTRTGRKVWSASPGDPGAISSSPAFLAGVQIPGGATVNEVVAGSEGGSLDAFDASTGAPLWSTDLGSPVDFSSPGLLPAVDPNPCETFVGTMDGMVHALDCSTGTPLWSYSTGAPIQASPAIASCGDGCEEVAVGSEDGTLYGLDSMSGDQRWATHLDGGITSSAAFAGGVIFDSSRNASDDGQNLQVLDPTTGDLLGDLPGPTGLKQPFPDPSPIAIDGTIALGTIVLSLFTTWPQSHFDAAHDGFQAWDSYLNQQTVGNLSQAWSDGFASTLLGDPKDGGGVYVGQAGGPLFAVDEKTGVTKWQFDSGGEPVYDKGTVYVAEPNTDHFYALDSSNGGIKWDVSTIEPVQPPAVQAGAAYVSGWTYASFGFAIDSYDTSTGSLQWRFEPPPCFGGLGNYPAAAATGSGLVFLSVAENCLPDPPQLHVWAIDPATHSPVWETAVPVCDLGYGYPTGPAFATIAGNQVYVAGNFSCQQPTVGELIALDITNGNLNWTHSISGTYTGPAAVAYARVYVGTSGGTDGDCLYALGIFSAITLWSKCTPGHAVHTPAVANGVVYFGDDDGIVYTQNAYTGASLGAPYVGGGGALDVSVADGFLFVPTADGHLYAFST